MDKVLLSKEQIFELVLENKYKVKEENKLLSRCIDGRYKNSDDLPSLGLAGADVGELVLIVSTGNTFGFDVDVKKTYETVIDLVGGVKNFQMHTDHHGDVKIAASGCGHWKQIKLDPTAYHLTQDQLVALEEVIEEARKKGAHEVILEGEHIEGAVLQVRGKYSVKPRYVLGTGSGAKEVEVFVYHESLVKERHKKLAEMLLKNKAVKLYNGLGADYLYDVLSDTTEDHLFETAKRLAKGLPIYSVVFKDDGVFDLEEMGCV